jgi:hypothetical protein
MVRYIYAIVAGSAVVGLFVLPFFYTPTHHAALSRGQTAAAGDVEDGYPVPMSFEEAGLNEADYPDYDSYGGGTKDGYGSLKDGGGYADYGGYDDYTYDTYYDNSYDTYDPYYEDEYYYREPSYSSYGADTSQYIAAGLSLVPLILADSVSPQTRTTYSYAPQQSVQYVQPSYTYTNSYVPVQSGVGTYAVPAPIPVTVPVTNTYASSFGSVSVPDTHYQQQTISVSRPTGAPVVNPGGSAVTITESHSLGTNNTVAYPQAFSAPQQIAYGSFVSQPTRLVAPQQVTVSHSQAETIGGAIGIDTSVARKAPATCSLKAGAVTLARGATTTITWKSTGATSASMPPFGAVATEGSKIISVATTTTLTLSVVGETGTTTCSVKLSVDPNMCAPGCPPGFVCTPIATSTSATEKKPWYRFW